jgi:nucleoid-associated protein YgaU
VRLVAAGGTISIKSYGKAPIMRPDVKLGVIAATAVVFVIGGYFAYRDKDEPAIPVAAGPEALKDAFTAAAPDEAKTNIPTRDNRRESAPDRSAARPNDPSAIKQPTRRVPPNVRIPNTNSRSLANQPVVPTKSGGQLSSSGTIDREGDKGAGSAPEATELGGGTITTATEPLSSPGLTSEGASRVASAAESVAPSTPEGPSSSSALEKGEAGSRLPVALTAPSTVKPASGDRTAADSSATETHRVQPGDTLVTLAEQYYGSARFVSLLQSANPRIIDPRNLPVGMVVKIPARPADAADALAGQGGSNPAPILSGTSRSPISTPGPVRTYAVKSGDSFYKIARDVLGDANRWQELFEMNRDRVKGEPRSLQVGQEIVLPAK